MTMSAYPDAASSRMCVEIGNSVGVTLDSPGLRSIGIEPTELQGEELPTKIEDGEFKVDLSAFADD